MEASRKALAALKQQRRCEGSLIWWEARGEASKAQRGVLDVARNRAEEKGKSVCQIIAEKEQFVWYKSNRIVPLDDERKAMLDSASSNSKVLTNEKWFYSGPRPLWAKNMTCRVMGHLHFCKEKK